MIKTPKINEIDAELIAAYDKRIAVTEEEKRINIRVNMENEIRNVYNLINDPYFIDGIEKHVPAYVLNGVGRMLKELGSGNPVEVSNIIDAFIEKQGVYFAAREFNKQVNSIKKVYLRKLRQAEAIATA